jgi:osomolarity two-component system, response regulator SSK1
MSKKSHVMGEIKTRILPLFRRSSASSSKSVATSSVHSDGPKSRSKVSLVAKQNQPGISESVLEEPSLQNNSFPSPSTPLQLSNDQPPTPAIPLPKYKEDLYPSDDHPPTPTSPLAKYKEDLYPSNNHPPTPASPISKYKEDSSEQQQPLVILQKATPEQNDAQLSTLETEGASPKTTSPPAKIRSHGSSKQRFLKTLAQSQKVSNGQIEATDYFSSAIIPTPSMVPRRVWVKRPGASATLVPISEEDLVDDARDRILRKYANSLGKTFDSPDVTLRIIPRANSHGQFERSLGPEEQIARTLDIYFPDGQTVDEALVIDVPHRRTPRHSPRTYADRPSENGGEYFPVMPVGVTHSPNIPGNVSVAGSTGSSGHQHAMNILASGHPPPLPSPGGARRRTRQKPERTLTSSPTVAGSNPLLNGK